MDIATRKFEYVTWFVTGMFVAATLTFLFEPSQGRRRRSYIRDKTRHYLREGKSQIFRKVRNLRNRAKGLPYRLSNMVRSNIHVDDAKLIERVRSVMGRKVTHPRAIQVEASNGIVTLSGEIPSNEIVEFVRAVKRVPGVQKVKNHLNIQRATEQASTVSLH